VYPLVSDGWASGFRRTVPARLAIGYEHGCGYGARRRARSNDAIVARISSRILRWSMAASRKFSVATRNVSAAVRAASAR